MPTHIVVGDDVIASRDKLVKAGKLNPPLTDTYEFRDTIMSKIEYWDGKKFVQFFPK